MRRDWGSRGPDRLLDVAGLRLAVGGQQERRDQAGLRGLAQILRDRDPGEYRRGIRRGTTRLVRRWVAAGNFHRATSTCSSRLARRPRAIRSRVQLRPVPALPRRYASAGGPTTADTTRLV